LPKARARRVVKARFGQRPHTRVGEQRRRGKVHDHALEPSLGVGGKRQARHLFPRQFGLNRCASERIGRFSRTLRGFLPVAFLHAIHRHLIGRAVGPLRHQRHDPQGEMVAGL
jgi:hypothetical protein